MKTQVLFFFDTEDFTSADNADAILGITKILEEEGVTGHFAVVGLLAKQLTNWGREDVKAALGKHIIGNHTYGHTLHPDITELSDGEDYTAAHQRVMESEGESVRLLREHLGVELPMFAVPPGNSVTYVGMYCYHEMGIPFFCDSMIRENEDDVVDFCSMTHLPYSYGFGFEELFLDQHMDNDEILEKMSGHTRVSMFLHPNMCFDRQYWDMINYYHENTYEFGQWQHPEKRPLREVIEYWHDIRMLIRRLKNDERFELVTLRDIKDRLDRNQPKPITKEDFIPLAEALERDFSPAAIPGYSISDLCYAAAAFLRGEELYCPGTVKGFLYPPQGVASEVMISREAVSDAASEIRTGEFLPPALEAGGVRIGPADFLFAALRLLSSDASSVTVAPRAQDIDPDLFPDLKRLDLVDDLWCRSYDFKDEYVSDRIRLQTWTIRYRL